MRRPRIQLVAALLLLAIASAGCGDDDEPAAERTDAAPARTEPRTATEPETDTAEATGTTETEAGGSGAAGDLPDACKLLGASEVREAAGRDVDPREEQGESVDGFAYRQCNWTAVGFEDSVAVRVVSGTERYDTLMRDLGGAGAQISRLSGLGDAAFLASGFSGESAGASQGATVFVKAGGRTLSIALRNANDEGPREELIGLMESMLSKAG